MDTQSQHLLADFVLDHEITDKDLETIKAVIEKNFTVVKRAEHKFSPHGETIVFILAESHFTIHTYPEHNYITMDIYICNPNVNLEKVLHEIKSNLRLKKIESRILERGAITVEDQKFKLKILYILTIIVAMGSILYELLLAQSLSTIMGNTALRYNVTIGIYIASMGFGAIFYKHLINSKKMVTDLLKVELLLTIVGGLAPILVLAFDYYANKVAIHTGLGFYSSSIQIPIFIFNHFLIFLVGFISGLELPLLINIGKNLMPSKNNSVLAFDYLGTLIGAILFPLILLPNFNLFMIGFLVSLLNVVVSVIVAFKLERQDKKWIFISLMILFVWLLLLINNQVVSDFIINQFYFGGKL